MPGVAKLLDELPRQRRLAQAFDVALGDFEIERTHGWRSQAVSDCIQVLEPDRLSGFEGRTHGRCTLGLDAVDPCFRAQRPIGGCDSAYQAAAPYAADDGVEMRQIILDLQPHGAVTGNQHRIIEGVNEREAAALFQLMHFLEGGVDVAMQYALGAVPARSRYFARCL